MLTKFRREAAILAAYLSQFENPPDTDNAEHLPTGVTPPESHAQAHADYQQACQWLAATACTDDDVAALAHMRRHYGFP